MKPIKRSFVVGCIAAFAALVVPAVSGAAEITIEGRRAQVGEEMFAYGGTITFNSKGFGKIDCRGFEFRTKVFSNRGTFFEAGGNTPNPVLDPEHCGGTHENFMSYSNFNVEKLFATELPGPSGAIKRGYVNLTFNGTWPSEIHCKFTGKEVPFQYVSGASPAVLTFTDTGGHVTSAGGCGNGSLEGSFSFRTRSKAPVVFR